MLKSYSDNAILAKARAMFGRRLTKEQYDQMLRMNTVPEVAAFLKGHPNYQEALANMDIHNVHRGQLEAVLRRNLLHQYSKLVRYNFSTGMDFYQSVVLRSEVDQIIIMLRLLHAGAPESYILMLPGYLKKHACFDLDALSKVDSFESLLKVLRHSPYYQVLYRCRPTADQPEINLTACEQLLQTYYYRTVLGIIDHDFSGEVKEQLRSLMLLQVDALNLSYAYRLRRFFKAGSDHIRAAMLPFDTPSKKVIERIIEADTPEEIAEAIKHSRYRYSQAMEGDAGYIEAVTAREEYAVSKHNLRFSSSPQVVLVSYIIQLTLELENIITIIEGVRYALPGDEIGQLLIM